MTRIANVVLHGGESTGKSTLASRLAGRFGVPLVTEFGRDYCLRHGTQVTEADLVAIMHGHMAATAAARQQAAAMGAGFVVSDTDPLMTAAWAMMQLGRRVARLDTFADLGDLYLLLADDLPWVDDGLRLHRTPAERARFQSLARAELARRGIVPVEISGDSGTRLGAAVAAICNAGLVRA
jgi:NadR type nicotinamide-nucleotide adenylyltransferase